ncbi:hypothetical protein [Conexibacter sp. SYSU D00693]|uniref:hypothetical protein n=1 Tax=Conexibacter sp. SYSU D00693 TaxID=2812560 RepID=UPI00196A519E|nr:hypothetical protein [Conexibacter sp. SYSU D00693]
MPRRPLSILAAAAAAAAVALPALLAPAHAHAAGCVLNIGSCLVVTPPPASLNLGQVNAATTTTSAEQVMQVAAGNSWGMRISVDQAGGRMREHNGTSYVASGKVMHHPLQWRLSSFDGTAQSTSFADLSTTPAVALTNRSITGCVLLLLLCTDIPLGFRFRMTTSFWDANAGANNYRIQVTYDTQLGF